LGATPPRNCDLALPVSPEYRGYEWVSRGGHEDVRVLQFSLYVRCFSGFFGLDKDDAENKNQETQRGLSVQQWYDRESVSYKERSPQ
jgi:hypothetical protein